MERLAVLAAGAVRWLAGWLVVALPVDAVGLLVAATAEEPDRFMAMAVGVTDWLVLMPLGAVGWLAGTTVEV